VVQTPPVIKVDIDVNAAQQSLRVIDDQHVNLVITSLARSAE